MRYAAFISYNHKDKHWADWLHRQIEGYRLPKRVGDAVAGSTGRMLKPVFLDRAELPSSADLAGHVRTALEASEALIVICSVAAAASRWVNEEVRIFKSLGRGQRIFCLVVDGDPSTGDCFPPAIRFAVEGGEITRLPAAEPMAADVRAGKDDRSSARLKIIAGLLELPFDSLKQRDLIRRQRRLALVATASAIGCVAFATLSVLAMRARAEAELQRERAEQQSMTAKRTAEFMKSLFAVSDPSESRGNKITAREVLDRGARQVDLQLKDAPLVRADLTTTLGEVYGKLGLFDAGLNLLQRAERTPNRPAEESAQTLIAIAELQTQRADYIAALAALDAASKSLAKAGAPGKLLEMRILATYGDVFNFQDDPARARDYFKRALSMAERTGQDDAASRVRFLQGIAQTDMADGNFDAADSGLRRALAEQEASTGELHPRVAELLNELGTLEYLRGRRTNAIPYYRRCLAIERRILGSRHPDTGPTINNLARLLLETRQFEDANQLLQESIDIRKGQVLDTDDAMAFAYSNLAIARMNLMDTTSAEKLFHQGLAAAITNKHRLHGPILTDLADLECRTGRYQQGLKRLEEARPIVAARYPDDPWRMAHVDQIHAGCLTGLKRYEEAIALMSSSLPVEMNKWPADTMYGQDALRRAADLYTRAGKPREAAVYRAQLQRP